MNRRIRHRSSTTIAAESYLRYLKPGALAKLRDSKIKHRSSPSDSQIHLIRILSSPAAASSSPPRSPSFAQQEVAGAIAALDGGSPCFAVRFYGPRYPQRKKLMAARSMFFLNPNSSVSDVAEPVIDPFANDFVVAH
uniref:uncharacterized protein LOC122594562 n=1 Tax=Erigeron canadensis TaxID=72917 RepID=UPI001CB92D6E|nr:uncharacterized protein LOC122594562 [Erigeron canadensis]